MWSRPHSRWPPRRACACCSPAATPSMRRWPQPCACPSWNRFPTDWAATPLPSSGMGKRSMASMPRAARPLHGRPITFAASRRYLRAASTAFRCRVPFLRGLKCRRVSASCHSRNCSNPPSITRPMVFPYRRGSPTTGQTKPPNWASNRVLPRPSCPMAGRRMPEKSSACPLPHAHWR